jgi:hypothetical protein
MSGACRQAVRRARWLWPAVPGRRPAPPRRRGWIYVMAALLLGGYLLFAHGCHGDEDNELFAAARAVPGVSGGW